LNKTWRAERKIIMPTYQNITESSAILGVYGSIAAGDSIYVSTYLPAGTLAGNFEITAEEPSPWDIVSSDSLPHTFSSLEKYVQVEVYNGTSAVIFLAPNGFSTDAVKKPVAPGAMYPISPSGKITSLTASGAGTGTVYLTCTAVG
jgi:hypothetical protein